MMNIKMTGKREKFNHWDTTKIIPIKAVEESNLKNKTLNLYTHLEELSQGNIVQTIWAIEDYALFGNRFGQVFSCFGLSSSSWSFRSATYT